MTPRDAFAVVGVIAAFVVTTTWLIDRLASVVDRRRAHRELAKLGHLDSPSSAARPEPLPGKTIVAIMLIRLTPNASMASIVTMTMARNTALRYRDGGMTRAGAEHLAQKLWTDGPAVGQVRWRRTRTPRFWVGVCFADGRAPETKGESNVDWESAFTQAIGHKS